MTTEIIRSSLMPAAMGTELSSSYRRVMHARGAATIFNGVLPHTYVAQRKKKKKKKKCNILLFYTVFFFSRCLTLWSSKTVPGWNRVFLLFFLISVRGICSASLSSRKCSRGNSLSRCETDLNSGTRSSVCVVQCSPVTAAEAACLRAHW